MSLFKNDLVKTSTFFGLSGGALGLVNFFIAKFLGLNPFPSGTDFPWIISVILLSGAVIGAILYFRKVENQNVLHFWQGLSIGFVVWVSYMFVECTGIFIYLKIDDAYLQQYLQLLADGLIQNKAEYLQQYNEADFNQFVLKMKETSAGQMTFDGFIKKSPFPALVSFIAAMVLRRHNRDENGNLI